MEFANNLILLGAGLIMVSILAGMLSSRLGAPLLLVFLLLGMLAGEDGPGGIDFDDFGAAYLIGSVALAVILFDGGLRTRRADFTAALAPAGVLASAGVLLTAGITGVAASWLLGMGWLEGFLLGSIVASTDAAAVFLLLNLRGVRLRERVRTTLEVEAGLNDPMAVFLTITCVELLMSDATLSLGSAEALLGRLALQLGGGIALGVLGGIGINALVNRLSLAAGLYPVVVVALVLLLFAGSQSVGASGFLATYLAGFVLGNRRHRATLTVNRFLDALAWLSQITMFLVLGLLVTPTALLPHLVPALLVSAVLILVARPVAGALCLLPFRFSAKEIGFISWVGLRGAVPIYLGTIPVLAGAEQGGTMFSVVYVVVIASLIVQGWTIALAGRRFGVMLPPRPAAPPRLEIDLPNFAGSDIIAYTVQPGSLAIRRRLDRLPLPEGAELISVVRDGTVYTAAALEQLSPEDCALVMAPAESIPFLDRLFGAKEGPARAAGDPLGTGEFPFAGDTRLGAIAELYGLAIPMPLYDTAAGAFLKRYLPGRPAAGRRLCIGDVELTVREVADGVVTQVALSLMPERRRTARAEAAYVWLRAHVLERARTEPR